MWPSSCVVLEASTKPFSNNVNKTIHSIIIYHMNNHQVLPLVPILGERSKSTFFCCVQIFGSFGAAMLGAAASSIFRPADL